MERNFNVLELKFLMKIKMEHSSDWETVWLFSDDVDIK